MDESAALNLSLIYINWFQFYSNVVSSFVG